VAVLGAAQPRRSLRVSHPPNPGLLIHRFEAESGHHRAPEYRTIHDMFAPHRRRFISFTSAVAVIDQDITKTRARPRSFAAVYGVAHGGKSLFWHASELLFGYFLTEICALSPQQMGLILSGSMLLSALVDVLTGRYLACSVTTTGRAAEVQWLGALASCLAFAVFGVSSLAPLNYRFAFALVSMIAFRLAYAFLDNPQNAMLASCFHL